MDNPQKPKWLNNWGGFLNNKIKGFDSYGVPVSLNFRGEDTFKTTIGGIVSIFAFILISLYSISQASVIINRGNTTINSNILSRNLLESKKTFDIANKDFIIGLGGDQGEIYNPTYFQVHFNNYIQERDKLGGVLTRQETNTMGTRAWGTDYDRFLDSAATKGIGMN